MFFISLRFFIVSFDLGRKLLFTSWFEIPPEILVALFFLLTTLIIASPTKSPLSLKCHVFKAFSLSCLSRIWFNKQTLSAQRCFLSIVSLINFNSLFTATIRPTRSFAVWFSIWNMQEMDRSKEKVLEWIWLWVVMGRLLILSIPFLQNWFPILDSKALLGRLQSSTIKMPIDNFLTISNMFLTLWMALNSSEWRVRHAERLW